MPETILEPVQESAEQPIYILPQSKKRALIPKIISLLILGGIFYLGVLLNISLLNLTANQEQGISLASLIILLLVIFLGIYLSLRRANKPYEFYKNRIAFNKKEIFYTKIINTAAKQDFLDKIFKTCSVNLGNNFHLRNISQQVQISDYLQKLINYSQSQTPTTSSPDMYQ